MGNVTAKIQFAANAVISNLSLYAYSSFQSM